MITFKSRKKRRKCESEKVKKRRIYNWCSLRQRYDGSGSRFNLHPQMPFVLSVKMEKAAR